LAVILVAFYTHDAPYGHYVKHDVIHKTGRAKHIAMPPKEQDGAMGNMHKI